MIFNSYVSLPEGNGFSKDHGQESGLFAAVEWEKKTAKDTGRRTWTCVNLDESETLMTFFMTHDPQ